MHQPLPPTSEIDQHLAPVYRHVEQRIAQGHLRRRLIAGAGLVAVLGAAGTTAAVGTATRHAHSETFVKSSYAAEFASCVQKTGIETTGVETSVLSGPALTKILRESGAPTDGSVSVFQIVYPEISGATLRAARAMSDCGKSLSAAYGENIYGD